MDEPVSLSNQFLIAMPTLQDPNFSRTVTYMCEHNRDGAMGIVINRPLGVDLGEVLGQMEIECADSAPATLPVYQGGPVQPERGFVLHRPFHQWESAMQITDDLGISTSRDILTAIASGEGPEQILVALGYAGWAPGQLEQELANNAWLNGPANPEILFNTPDENRWEMAAASFGVDLNLLSGDTGHA